MDWTLYAYPIVETGDTLAWDGTGWHHLTPAGVWSTVAGGPTNPLPYPLEVVTYTDTETWVGDSTPGNGRWWSPDGGWRTDHRNYAYTQMWGLADGAVWTDGTDYWRTQPGSWGTLPTPDPLLGFDQFAGDYDHVVGYNSQDGYWGYSIQGDPWVLGLRERVYLLEQGGGQPGPAGPTGPTGPQGPAGPPGADGQDGTNAFQPTITTFGVGANQTWTIPAASTFGVIKTISSGSGGGSGRRGAAGTNRTGGAGGGSGGVTETLVDFAALRLLGYTTLYVTVPAGGAGGAAVTTDDTDGNPGASGGDAIVKLTSGAHNRGNTLAVAIRPSLGGAGGKSTSVLGGNTGNAYFAGSDGGLGQTGGGDPGKRALGSGGSGAGGGAIDSTNTVKAPGQPGGDGLNQMGFPSGGGAGTSLGPAGTVYTFSTGGAGGNASLTAAGGKGGDGGNYGGGGGGGAASVNGYDSGAGGDGGPGLVVITAY